MLLSFDVLGKPKTAGSKRAVPYFEKAVPGGGPPKLRAAIRDDSGEKGYSWRDDVRSACSRAMRANGWVVPNRGTPLFLIVEFRQARPQSHYRKGGVLKAGAPDWCAVRPDATKMLRAVEDALNGVAWADDSDVVVQFAHKVYDRTPSAAVRIGVLDSALHGPAVGALFRAFSGFRSPASGS